jgi:hypothetical protein
MIATVGPVGPRHRLILAFAAVALMVSAILADAASAPSRIHRSPGLGRSSAAPQRAVKAR